MRHLFLLLIIYLPIAFPAKAEDKDASILFENGADLESLDGKSITGFVIIPPTELNKDRLPSKLLDKRPFSKYVHMWLNAKVVMVVSLYDSRSKDFRPGRIFSVSGKLERFVGDGRVMVDGVNKPVYQYCFYAKNIKAAYELPKSVGDSTIDLSKYTETDHREIFGKLRNRWQHNDLIKLKVFYDGIQSLPKEILEHHDIKDNSKWKLVRHKEADNLPIILLPPDANIPAQTKKSLRPGKAAEIYGSLFLTIKDNHPAPGILLHTARPADGFFKEKEPAENSGVAVKGYQHISQRLLKITANGICDGLFNATHKTGHNLETTCIKTDFQDIDQDTLNRIPHLKGRDCRRLAPSDSDLGDQFVIIVPRDDKKLFRSIKRIENGDTVNLQCKLGRIDNRRFYLEVKGVTLPPIQ